MFSLAYRSAPSFSLIFEPLPSPSPILFLTRWWQNSAWSHPEPPCLPSMTDHSQRWRHRSAARDSACLLQFSPRTHPSPLLIRSASSSDRSSTSRSAEGKAVRAPSKSSVRRHTSRLSGGFLRGPSSGSMSLTAGIRSSLSIQARKGSSMSRILYIFPACLVLNCVVIGRYGYKAAVAACSMLSSTHFCYKGQLTSHSEPAVKNTEKLYNLLWLWISCLRQHQFGSYI